MFALREGVVAFLCPVCLQNAERLPQRRFRLPGFDFGNLPLFVPVEKRRKHFQSRRHVRLPLLGGPVGRNAAF